jgi:RNA polymerase sigma-70 factor (ECF subfamily)
MDNSVPNERLEIDPKEQELIENAQKGDSKAFDELVKKYQKRIYFLAKRFVKSHDLADEIAQESFVKAYFSLKQFKLGMQFYSWVYRICVNLALDHLRKEKFFVYENKEDKETDILENIPSSNNPLSELLNEELNKKIEEAIEKLPTEFKTVFILRVYDELSYEEIAKVLKITKGTVMSRLFRAREKLRRILKDVSY